MVSLIAVPPLERFPVIAIYRTIDLVESDVEVFATFNDRTSHWPTEC